MIPHLAPPARWGGANLAMSVPSFSAALDNLPVGSDLHAWGSEVMAHVRLMPGDHHPAKAVRVNRLSC